MSPQLGTGTSLALADAWTLHHALATASDLPRRAVGVRRGRAAHVRWYQWWTRLMMPVFQSGLTPLAWPRDLLAPYVIKVPGMSTTAGHHPDRRPHVAVVDLATPGGTVSRGRWPRPRQRSSLGLLALAIGFGWLGSDVDRGAVFCEVCPTGRWSSRSTR